MANPLIKMELMRRFRSPLAAWGIPLVLLLPGLAVVTVYATTIAFSDFLLFDEPEFGSGAGGDYNGIPASALQGVGTGMFVAVLVALFFTLLVLVPAMVGGSIAGERHSQTLQPLQLTAMGPTQIIFGKLVSSLAYLVVALLCAAPVLAVPFLLGGLSASEVTGAYVVMLLITIEFAAVSLAVSSVMSRPAPAIVVSLVACGVLAAAPWIAAFLGFVVLSVQDPMLELGDTGLRYLAGVSPVSLGSWVVNLGEVEADVGDTVNIFDMIGSLFWFLVVTIGSLAIARANVTAPMERDR